VRRARAWQCTGVELLERHGNQAIAWIGETEGGALDWDGASLRQLRLNFRAAVPFQESDGIGLVGCRFRYTGYEDAHLSDSRDLLWYHAKVELAVHLGLLGVIRFHGIAGILDNSA